jgi:hypothetical protein
MRTPLIRLFWVMVGRSLAASNPVRALAGRVGGVFSIAIGIVSILLGLIPCINILAVLLSLIGITVGFLAYRQSRLALSPTRYAVSGIVISIIGLFVSIGVSRSLYDKYYGHEGKQTPAERNEGKDW